MKEKLKPTDISFLMGYVDGAFHNTLDREKREAWRRIYLWLEELKESGNYE